MRAILPSVAFLVLFASAGPTFSQAEGVKYAILIGCRDYRSEVDEPLDPLPPAKNDVIAFAEALKSKGFEDPIILHDDQSRESMRPTKANVIRALSEIRTSPEDTLVVALSGHGVQFVGDDFPYFCPTDADIQQKSTLIAMEASDALGPDENRNSLAEILKRQEARRKLLIVNACRNDPRKKNTFAIKKIRLDDQHNLKLPAGIAWIRSCRETQFSYFDRNQPKPQSVFFEHLTRAWRGVGAREGKVIKVLDVFRELEEKVPTTVANDLKEKPQTPEYGGIPTNASPGNFQVHIVPTLKPIREWECDEFKTYENRLFKGEFSVNVKGSKFVNCRFESCSFSEATSFTKSRFYNCTFANADFSSAFGTETMELFDTPIDGARFKAGHEPMASKK